MMFIFFSVSVPFDSMKTNDDPLRIVAVMRNLKSLSVNSPAEMVNTFDFVSADVTINIVSSSSSSVFAWIVIDLS